MTGTNHALTGAAIGFLIGSPMAVIPAAFLSHFVLDALPHFGESFGQRKKLSKIVRGIDSVILASFLLVLMLTSSWIMVLGAVLAISPDFAWIYRFVIAERFGSLAPRPTNRFNTFHAAIQKFESRNGLMVEVIWFAIFAYLNLGFIS
jgi:hypothetical protein